LSTTTDMIIGSSRAINELRALISQAASSDASVLILGESGTGKELVARALHTESKRSSSNFVPVNCGAIPRELLESELFGHKRGAFTGAISDRMGRFELAHNGTLFLDEIGDMPIEMQVKLLRVLQEQKVDPVGSTKSIDVNVRIVAATHRNLDSYIQEGDFREDLYYRLNVIPVILPSLRERQEDIPELIQFYLEKHSHDGQVSSFDGALIDALCKYAWPGNIRELVNLVHRLCCFFPSQSISLSQIPASLLPRSIAEFGASSALSFDRSSPKQSELDLTLFDGGDNPIEDIVLRAQGVVQLPNSTLPNEGLNLKNHLAEIEKQLIIDALSKCGGNVSQSAKLLNLQRTTLIEKINKYEIQP
jgi:sigma-54 specific flagellar transcriptional regulator A